MSLSARLLALLKKRHFTRLVRTCFHAWCAPRPRLRASTTAPDAAPRRAKHIMQIRARRQLVTVYETTALRRRAHVFIARLRAITQARTQERELQHHAACAVRAAPATASRPAPPTHTSAPPSSQRRTLLLRRGLVRLLQHASWSVVRRRGRHLLFRIAMRRGLRALLDNRNRRRLNLATEVRARAAPRRRTAGAHQLPPAGRRVHAVSQVPPVARDAALVLHREEAVQEVDVHVRVRPCARGPADRL